MRFCNKCGAPIAAAEPPPPAKPEEVEEIVEEIVEEEIIEEEIIEDPPQPAKLVPKGGGGKSSEEDLALSKEEDAPIVGYGSFIDIPPIRKGAPLVPKNVLATQNEVQQSTAPASPSATRLVSHRVSQKNVWQSSTGHLHVVDSEGDEEEEGSPAGSPRGGSLCYYDLLLSFLCFFLFLPFFLVLKESLCLRSLRDSTSERFFPRDSHGCFTKAQGGFGRGGQCGCTQGRE